MAKILVVDDEWDIRELLVDTILEAGHDVIEAGDGITALERIDADYPDIVFLDIWMPGMDGLTVLEKLRENPDTAAMPVVLLTAMSASEGERASLEMGVTHYLNKPWEPGMIEATIRVVIREAGLDPSGAGQGDSDIGLSSVDLKSDQTNQISNTAMARLRTGRKKKNVVLNEEGQEIEVIATAEKLTALEQKMGGGLPFGTVNLAAGAAASGKSVLCQHMVYGALESDYGVAFFSSETDPEGMAIQMASIGMDVNRHMRTNKLSIYPVPEPGDGEEPGPVLAELSRSIESLSRGAQFVVIDSITDLAGSSPEQAVIGFFTTCRRLANQGRTIFVVVHSYAFGSEMFNRLRDLCDGYFSLGSEQMRGKSLRTVTVNKINTTEQSGNNMVSFVVEPDVGMRVIPMNKT